MNRLEKVHVKRCLTNVRHSASSIDSNECPERREAASSSGGTS